MDDRYVHIYDKQGNLDVVIKRDAIDAIYSLPDNGTGLIINGGSVDLDIPFETVIEACS